MIGTQTPDHKKTGIVHFRGFFLTGGAVRASFLHFFECKEAAYGRRIMVQKDRNVSVLLSED